MSAFVLKIIACITMLIDHVSYIIPHDTYYLNYIGRFAFPIFAFQISQGYLYSKNLKKYCFRLLAFAFISQIPFMLFHSLISESLAINVIFTLFFGFLTIFIFDRINKFFGIFIGIILGLIAEIYHFDYGFYGVAIVFLFYAFKDNKFLMTFAFILATLINYTYLRIIYNTKNIWDWISLYF